MVSEPTVLIVGAGGSLTYKYPSGTGLVDQIVTSLVPPAMVDDSLEMTPLFRTLSELGFKVENMDKFRTKLWESRLYSVDAFLERNPAYIDIGRAAIASVLVPLEDYEKLMSVDVEEDWYRILLNTLVANLEQGAKECLTIVTYNYDRSLDHYLYIGMQNALNKSLQEMSELMKNLKIIHVHGVMCGLPWQEIENDFPRPYGNKSLGHDLTPIKESAARIKIIHKNKAEDPAYINARAALSGARRVCFLGFGYHPTNVKRLLLGNWHYAVQKKIGYDKKLIIGSAYQLTDAEKTQKALLFNSGPDGPILKMGRIIDNCYDFLRQNITIIT